MDYNVQLQFYAIFAILFAVILALWLASWDKLKIFLSAALILFYGILSVFSFPYYNLTILFAIALILEIREFHRLYGFRSREGVWLASLITALMAMILLSGLLRVLPSAQGIE